MLHIKIVDSKDKKISINDAEKFISSLEFGASLFFTGSVRNQNNNKSVIGITSDSHDELVIKSFEQIYKEADKKLNIQHKAVFIEHAKGYLNLGEISIIIAVACKHRDEAYVLYSYQDTSGMHRAALSILPHTLGVEWLRSLVGNTAFPFSMLHCLKVTLAWSLICIFSISRINRARWRLTTWD